MENFSVSTVLTLDDWRALQHAVQLRQYSSPNLGRRLVLRWPLLVLGFMPLASLLWGVNRASLAFIVAIAVVLLLGAIHAKLMARNLAPKPGDIFFEPARFEFDAVGMRLVRSSADYRLQWSAVREIRSTPAHVFLWISQNSAFLIPARNLSGELNTTIAAERLRSLRSQADSAARAEPAPAATYSASVIVAETAPAAPRISLPQELGAVGKQLLLMRANASRLIGSDGAIALLGAIALAIWLPLDFFIYTGPLQFTVDQIGGLALVIAGTLALAWILSRCARPRIEYRRVLLIVTASMFIAILGSTVCTLAGDGWISATLALLAASAYATFYFKQALRTLTGREQMPALLVGALAAFLFVLMLDQQNLSPSLWVYAGDEDSETPGGTNYQDAWRKIEGLQFDQRARIDAQIAQIATQAAPGSQVYFVGFAGFGEQRVFAQEIELAARRIADQYGAGKREILLVNDRRDLEKYPLATVRALDYSLETLGKVMDEDDVLFLALSSHGDDDATLSVSNSGMMPDALDVDQLAEALRKSGIRWKVIVISACYAGSFIDSLADDHTIVLTAAASDRTSFGCADDRDLTYFGEAFYRDALPKAASLRAAFEAAKARIAERENAQGMESSNPQAAYGAALEAKLASQTPPR